jgi:3-hydroxyisobutyrate dehydrogenase-like beta-hydroxyacid dehydrogenase
MKLGFIGLGNMGHAMAKHLLAAKHEVAVYNRSRPKAESLRPLGARVAETPADAARGAEVVFTMLADDPAVEQVVFGETGLLAGLAQGAVHVSSSTISVALSDRLAQAHEKAGQRYVSAPVFGRPDAAEAKQLYVVAAGPTADVERCRPLLVALSRGMSVLGEKPSMANVVKLSGNFLIVSMIEALGEAFALARKSGIEPKAFEQIFQAVMGQTPVLSRYATLISAGQYEPAGFALRLGLKDVRLVLEAAGAAQVPMPFASLARDHYLAAMAKGMGDVDWSALAALAAERAGLPVK